VGAHLAQVRVLIVLEHADGTIVFDNGRIYEIGRLDT
jgi:hypothetical protein